jgi:Dolichyl-phosphate-mannose-protein mannosyltransferase
VVGPGLARRALYVGLALAFPVVFAVQGWFFIQANSQTFDEAVHLTAGYSYWTTGDFRLNREHPPFIKLLCALPVYLYYRLPFEPDSQLWQEAAQGEDRAQWWISRDFLYRPGVPAHDVLALGRLPNLLLGTMLIGLIGWWSHRLWGPRAALLAMALSAFEPNLVANAGLVTTDLGVTLFMFLTLYLLWEYCLQPRRRLLVAVGVAFGLVLVTKFSCLLVAIILGAVLFAHAASNASVRGDSKQEDYKKSFLAAFDTYIRVLFVGILLILPCYFFHGFSDWLFGLRTQMNQQTTGKGSFFLGEYSDGGWWSYFLISLLIKTPIGSLLLILASLCFFRAGKPLDRRTATFLLLPVVLYLLALTRLRLNIGLRYALPIYPFLFVLASRVATFRFRPGWLAAVLVGIPITATAISSMHRAPHQLAYFNELIGGPEEGYRFLSNSNVDWGQDLRGVKEYMDREDLPILYLSYYGTAVPEAYGIRYQHVPGYGQLGVPQLDVVPDDLPHTMLAISVVNLQGVHCTDRRLFSWLLDRQPVAKIGYSIFVYDISRDAEAHRRLAHIYQDNGPAALATVELRKERLLER